MKTVELSKLAEEMDLKNLTPEVDMSEMCIRDRDFM